jgi:hypothetical protein
MRIGLDMGPAGSAGWLILNTVIEVTVVGGVVDNKRFGLPRGPGVGTLKIPSPQFLGIANLGPCGHGVNGFRTPKMTTQWIGEGIFERGKQKSRRQAERNGKKTKKNLPDVSMRAVEGGWLCEVDSSSRRKKVGGRASKLV